MKFYKVIKEKHDYFTGYSSIIGELLTDKERNKKLRYLSDDCFEIVNVSKKNTFWNFGARFECKGKV